MVTPRNFGREIVLRRATSSCTEGCQRASFELLVKKATSHLLVFRGKLAAPAPFCHVRYSFLNGCFSDFFIGVAAEVRNIVGKHGHHHVFGYDPPKVVGVQQEEER